MTIENEPITGGRALAEMFKAANCGPMFGMGGFQLLPFYDAVGRLGLQHYLINDERTGAFAADAYARVTNKVGICDATLGPGATNLVTGLAEAYNAGTPMIAITGDAHRLHAHKNMTQETRQVDALRPVVKDVLRVEMVSRIPEFVRRAYQIATAGRPGPVLLDVPEDIAHGEHTFDPSEFFVDPATTRIPSRRSRPARADTERAAAILGAAKRPLILAGGGVHLSDATQELELFARAMQMPVAHTLSGKGAIACTDPLSIGLFGRYSRIANDLIASSDCLLVVGCKLGEIATRRYELLSSKTPVIHLDIVAEEFGRTTAADVCLWGDVREGLADLMDAAGRPDGTVAAARAEQAAEIGPRMAKWRDEARARLQSTERPINMARLVNELNAVIPEDGIVVADGGFAAHWTGLIYDTKRCGRGYVADRGLASIGYGLPGAIGCALGAPGRPVVSLTGDGGFNMTLGDLETAKRIGVSPIIVVVNNAASGYIKALQHAMYDGHYQSSDLVEMNYAEIARAMGCRSVRLEDPEQIAPTFAKLIAEPAGPTVVDVVVTRDPGAMLPAVDSRTVKIKKGDRIA
ncbi:MAG: thiamine pyrophosphate-binding protein [Novosphingobium sp.]